MTQDKKFVHLHLHTEYSLLDGLVKVKELVAKAKEFGMPAVAVTDHGVMYGIPEFYFAAKAEGIKPIIGIEAYLVEDINNKKTIRSAKQETDDTKWFYHVTLLAKNLEGYKNLMHLSTRAFLDGFYYKPLMDKNLLRKYSKGLIALSGCGGGELAHTILQYKYDKDKAFEKAKPVVEEYMSIFGKDSYFLELQRLTMNDRKMEEFLIEVLLMLADEYKLKVVATNDTHYLEPSDAKIQSIIMALRQGKKLTEGEAFTLESQELYLKSPQEMIDLFADIPESIDTTLHIADMVEEYDITFERVQPPYLDLPKGKTIKEFLKEQAFKGAKERYGKITKDTEQRIDYELSVIDQKGYNEYFLVVADYVNWAKEQGILVGPGRGSGGGSVVAYSLGITDIDPLEWGLLFDRFLNPHRPSPPDFDVDFQDDRRDEVIEYLRQKYGKDKVAAIAAIGRMDTKAAIRDVARVLDIPLPIVDKFSKLIPVKRGKPMPIQDAVKSVPELQELLNAHPELKEVVEALKRIKKLARHVSVHACGYLITPEQLENYVPLRHSPQDQTQVITQIEGKYIEKLQLLKFDFLGLRTLTIISHALNAIKDFHGIDLTLEDIYKEKQDKLALKVYQKAETDGVFQLESQGMKNYLKQIKPTSLDDVNFLIAAYRPGPIKYIPEYIDRKFGKKPVTYPHPDLKPILEETYGLAIYQEQVLRIAVDIAGYSVGEADILRRAIGKKIKELLDKEKERFFKGALERGYSKKVVEKLWEFILPFADYGFNKSHSAAYTIISFYTAYLKGNYPVEFVYGLLSTDIDRPSRLEKDLKIAKRMHIQLLNPDINKSERDFKIEYINKEVEKYWLEKDFAERLYKQKQKGGKGVLGEIRIGFSAVKGVNSKTIDSILKERKEHGEFKDLQDFLKRLDYSNTDKKSLLLLAQVGAFDIWGERASIIKTIDEYFDIYKAQSNNGTSANQLSLLGAMGGAGNSRLVANVKLVTTEPVSLIQVLQWEKDAYGVYISSHPFLEIEEYLIAKGVTPLKEAVLKGGGRLRIAGFLRRIKKHTTSKGKVMGFADIEDHTTTVDGVFFSEIYDRFAREVIVNYDLGLTPFIFDGYLDKKPGVIGGETDPSQYSFRVTGFEVIDFNSVIKQLRSSNKKAFLQYIKKKSGKSKTSGFLNKSTNNRGKQIGYTLYLNKDLSSVELEKLYKVIGDNPGHLEIVLALTPTKRFKLKQGVNADVVPALKQFGILKSIVE